MAASPNRQYSRHCKAVEEQDNPGTLGKKILRRNVVSVLQLQLEEDGDGSSRQNCMESSGLCSMHHWD